MRRWLKNILNVTFCLIPIGIVIGFSTNWSHRIPISCVGSSGVKPFLENLATDYLKENKKVDVTVEAGGSGFGIEQIANGFANVGDTSKDPYSIVKSNLSTRDKWIERQIKTVTFGWEAICVVYIPPKGLTWTHDELRNDLTVNRDNIVDLMRIFSGYKDTKDGSWTDDLNKMSIFQNRDARVVVRNEIKEALKTQSITPYARTGGSLVSGTADSFYRETHLFTTDDPLENELTERQKSAFTQGKYGNEISPRVITTDEANSRAWDMFTKQNIPGSMVYLSSGFVQQNLNLIDKKGYGIMAYNNVPYDIKAIDDLTNGYNWLRPLNTMISLSPQNSDEKEFVKYLILLSSSEAGKAKLFRNGAKELSSKELESMGIVAPIVELKSDWDLIHNNWNSGYDFFGATPLMEDND